MLEKLEKYNFWSKEKTVPVGFLRNFYLEKIQKFMETDLIKILIGQRRVGKSYILKQIIDLLIKNKIPRILRLSFLPHQ